MTVLVLFACLNAYSFDEANDLKIANHEQAFDNLYGNYFTTFTIV